MDSFHINIQKYIPDLIEAYTNVYGEEYRGIISKRINSIIFFQYNNLAGMRNYILNLKSCKQNELGIKFLKEIGIDTSKYNVKSYSKLDNSLSDLLNRMDWEIETIKNDNTVFGGIGAWKPHQLKNKPHLMEVVQNSRIRFLNFLRGDQHPPITSETFEEFCTTDEYKQLLEKINEYLKIYTRLQKEYEDYLHRLEPYETYINYEAKRWSEHQTHSIENMYFGLRSYLHPDILSFLDERYSSTSEKSQALFGTELGIKSYAEYFSQEDEEKLADPSVSPNIKNQIYYYRIQYFNQLGISLDTSMFDIKSHKDIYEYYISHAEIKKLIMPCEITKKIQETREYEYGNFQINFYSDSENFFKVCDLYSGNIGQFFSAIHNQDIYTTCSMNGSLQPIICFTLWPNSIGKLDYILLHEITHAIECKEDPHCGTPFSGFEVSDSLNLYNRKRRKYEILNETITDMITTEVISYLHNKGIYMIEPKEVIVEDMQNFNTSITLKNILREFWDKYRNRIIWARLIGGMDCLFDRIGRSPFESLNNYINKVEYLKNFPDYSKVDFLQSDELKSIYEEMEEYQSARTLKSGILHSSRNMKSDKDSDDAFML